MALSYKTDIKPLFTAVDREHMLKMFDLWSYDDAQANADAVYDAVSSGRMPPEKGSRWPPDRVAKFKQWMDAGYPA